ncbi:transcriptional regulator Kaiso [Paramisgurnus dabryanus]|uniref:transcriptional regulator Kaiso n=1 Tax=Paramisgurnus dabryanus TaxID=90735 RepID=UPI0031F40FF8
MSKLKLISAEDTQYPASLLKSISEQRNNGLFCDVTIIVQDRKFKAHKTVLSASSNYFRQLFSVAGQVIELNFIKADIFEEILNYIYTSKIFRVRSDKLEDLISAGQILGVKFIANLGVPLSQVKGLPGLSKDGDNSNVNSSGRSESGAAEPHMPIITESFSLSAEEFYMGGSGVEKEIDSDNDDIVFVSKTEAPQAQKTKISGMNNTESEGGPQAKKQKVTNEETTVSKASTGHEGKDSTSSVCRNLPVQNTLPGPVIPIETGSSILTSPVRANSDIEPTTPTLINSPIPDANCTSPSLENNDVVVVHKKKVLPDHSGKIKLSDVRQICNTNNGPGGKINTSPAAVSAKKTITLDKASEIDSLSPGCKVYANIGEDTYDIVPVKDDPGEGVAPGRKSQMPLGADSMINYSPKGKRKIKQDQEDHYELVMDGKTFFVCVVCKRPYVCLTSLRRHFNTHSWERKYPCHYCNKVFALAEYRTKHEITHTGERRYQCLLCNETFLNYQILSNHCKQIHNQAPSGRKEKDDSCNNLYRLLPCKTLQLKSYSFVSEDSEGMPLIMDDGTVQHGIPDEKHFTNQAPSSPQNKTLTWDDIFAESESQTRPPPAADVQVEPPPRPANQISSESTTEFEFVIPETY